MTEKKDYIAICLVGSGSSYGRAPTTHQAVSLCKRSMEQDWKSLFQLDGVEVKINVYDVTGNTGLFWDHNGVHPDDHPEVTIPLHHIATARLSVPSQRKKKVKA